MNIKQKEFYELRLSLLRRWERIRYGDGDLFKGCQFKPIHDLIGYGSSHFAPGFGYYEIDSRTVSEIREKYKALLNFKEQFDHNMETSIRQYTPFSCELREVESDDYNHNPYRWISYIIGIILGGFLMYFWSKYA